MSLALKQALIAKKKNEIPVGCIIVNNDKVIAKAYNKREKTKKIIDHAEILAITKASKKLKTWNLSSCILYSTLEPCKMCLEAIKQSRIKIVYIGIKQQKNDNSDIILLENNTYSNEISLLMKEFFSNLRNN